MSTSTKARIAGAPISWGVCEVPGWGPMLPAPRVLRELRSLDLSAIELGAPGFLPDTAPAVKTVLDEHGVELVGGFVPVVLQNPSVRDDTLRQARETAQFFQTAGGRYFVSALVVDPGWGSRYPLSNDEWRHLIAMLDEIDSICADHGLVQVIHPHVNTLVETAADVQFVLDNSATKWCLDTGHLAIGGFDPVDFAARYADRVGHVHLKDVDTAIAAQLRNGEKTLMGATLAGMFRSLGEGDVDIAAVIANVVRSGYDGWFVLEQDISLSGEPPVEGTGPVEDVAVSLAYLRRELAALEG
jgi:inosose dehydratase